MRPHNYFSNFLILKLFLLTVLIFQLFSPYIRAQENVREIDVGVLANWPPQYVTDEATGQPSGFAADIMNEVAKRANIRIRYHVYPTWPKLNMALRQGEVDVIPNMGITSERIQDFDYTSPVEAFHIRIFIRSSTTDIEEDTDLSGRKVAVVETNKGRYIMEKRKEVQLLIYASMEEALMSLLSGNADALIYPEPPLNNTLLNTGLSKRIKTVGEPLIEVKRSIAVRKGLIDIHKKLNSAVEDLVGTPKFQKIYTKWYGKPKPFWNVTRVIIAMSIFLVLSIVSLAVWHYLSLLHFNKALASSLDNLKQTEETLRESEVKYRDLYDNAPDMFVSVDSKTGTIIDCNQTLTNVLGYTKEEIMGRTIFDMYTTESAKRAKDVLFPLFLKTGSIQGEELQLQRKDGSKIVVSLNASAVRDDQGNIIYSRSIWRDITKRKQAEEELEKHREHLEKLVEERTTELKEKVAELERMNDVFTKREFRIKELKNRIKELELTIDD